jgi:chondroitin 4-sulfotransferase 11
VATTNWKRVFLVLTGKARPDMKDLEKHNPHDKNNFRTLRDYSVKERIRLVSEYKKFLFVRHPFKRIVSAFYDRLHYDPRIQVRAHSFFKMISI